MTAYSVWKQKTLMNLDTDALDDLVNEFLQSVDDTLRDPKVTFRRGSDCYFAHIMYKEAKK